MEFVDRLLICADCGGEFIFTAGEQLFFVDKNFKNDPKRCKPCKSRRSAQQQGANPTGGPAAAGISRTETRTECSECGVSTTVPFKPTQGRPVLCRQCFKNKRPVAATETPATTPGTTNGTDAVAPATNGTPVASNGTATVAAPAAVPLPPVDLAAAQANLAAAVAQAQSPAELGGASQPARA